MTLKRQFFISVCAVFFVSFLFRINVINNLFVLDDFTLITNNAFVQSLNNLLEVLNPKNLFYVLPIRCGARPFTVASLIIDYSFFGANPAGYHIINLLIHSFNSVLVFLFAYFINCRRNLILPLTAALFFSLHPIQSEVVNVISFRADLLLMFFCLCALNLVVLMQCYNKRGKIFYFTVFIFVCCAFFTKENAIILPVALLLLSLFLYDDIKLKKISLISFFIILFLFLFFWITRFPVPLFYTVYPNLDGNFTPLSNIFTYFDTIAASLFYNIIHVLYPVNLSVDYIVKSSFYVYAFIPVFIFITIYLFLYRIKKSSVKLLLLLTVLSYLPVSNIVPLVNTVADRYMYLPMFSISLLFAFFTDKLANTLGKRKIYFFIICLFLLYTVISYQRGRSYSNAYSLYSDAIIKNPDNIRTAYNMGVAYFYNGEYDKAVIEFGRVGRLNPSYMRDKIWFLTGISYEERNNLGLARRYYYKAFLLNPLDDEIAYKFINSFDSADKAKDYVLLNTARLNDNIYNAFQKYSGK
ncbi:MAG: hypothetical protein WC234_02620 [Endomicrobiaceae bacterium]